MWFDIPRRFWYQPAIYKIPIDLGIIQDYSMMMLLNKYSWSITSGGEKCKKYISLSQYLIHAYTKISTDICGVIEKQLFTETSGTCVKKLTLKVN